jgi:hypothetical protein
MSKEPYINPRYLFPAPGWKCLQCSIFDDNTANFFECSVVGWGVVEGYGCDGYNPDASMQLLVALQDSPTGSPQIINSDELSKDNGPGPSNAVWGFLRSNDEFDGDYKAMLEEDVRAKIARQHQRKTKTVAEVG